MPTQYSDSFSLGKGRYNYRTDTSSRKRVNALESRVNKVESAQKNPIESTKEDNYNKLNASLSKQSAIGKVGEGVSEAMLGQTQKTIKNLEGKNAERVGAQLGGKIKRAGESTRSSANAAIGASGISTGGASAQLVKNEITKNANSDAMQKVLEGKVAKMNARFEGKQAATAGISSMLGKFGEAFSALQQSKYYSDKIAPEPIRSGRSGWHS